VIHSVEIESAEWVSSMLLLNKEKIDIEILTEHISREKLLDLLSKARVAISLGAGDGICTSLLEAMALGAFPIQSNTACTEDWVMPFRDAIVIDPEDTAALVNGLKIALTDNGLVDQAALNNEKTIRSKADYSAGVRHALSIYEMATQSQTKEG
jgi:glycosyltransferase involved in cell wall biosynthesis